MSSLVDRLRGVVRPGGSKEQDPPYVPPHVRGAGSAAWESTSADPANTDPVAEILGGEWRESHGQRYLIIDRKYSPGHRHGHVAVADVLPPADGMWPGAALLTKIACGANLSGLPGGPTGGAPAAPAGAVGCQWSAPRLLFVDLETTGLAGGAGTYAFLVGCGWFEGPTFRIRQLFLASFAAERALLQGLVDLVASSSAVVTYNGKTFDLPLIDTRYLFHRMETPFASLPHIDMLHCARRLWRADEAEPGPAASCRLSVIEHGVCGHLRENDVPGFEIPTRYFHYVRTSDARPLHAVVEHNRLDLLSLAWLTARAARLLEEGPAGARTAREAVGLGRLYERAGRYDHARASFARAAGIDDVAAGLYGDDGLTRAEALRAYAVLCRRERRYEEAAAAWRLLLELPRCPPHFTREATEALAVHHEHRARDLRAARRFALQALPLQATAARQQAVHHRLARLNRKLGMPHPDRDPAILF